MTARLRKPHIRVFNEERDRQTILVVDQRLSMFFGSRRAIKSVTAAEAAAIGAWRVLGVGDRVGAVVFGDDELVEVRARREPCDRAPDPRRRSSRKTRRSVSGAVWCPRRAMLNTAIDHARRRAPHDAVVVIISDFDGADDATRDMVSALTQHNDVIAVLVHDPLQSDLPPSASMTVTDGELQIQLNVGHDSVRKSVSQVTEDRLKGCFRLDTPTRCSGLAVERSRRHGAAASPPAW